MILMSKKSSNYVLVRRILITLFSFGLLMVGFKVAVTSVTSFGGDYHTYWQAGRAVFIREISSYDLSTTQIIQLGIYGDLARPEQDQLAFVFPPFSLLLVLPVVGLSYAWSQAYWKAFKLVLFFIDALFLYKKPPLFKIMPFSLNCQVASKCNIKKEHENHRQEATITPIQKFPKKAVTFPHSNGTNFGSSHNKY